MKKFFGISLVVSKFLALSCLSLMHVFAFLPQTEAMHMRTLHESCHEVEVIPVETQNISDKNMEDSLSTKKDSDCLSCAFSHVSWSSPFVFISEQKKIKDSPAILSFAVLTVLEIPRFEFFPIARVVPPDSIQQWSAHLISQKGILLRI